MEEERLDTVYSHLNAKGNVFAIGDCAWIEIDGNRATKTGLKAERQAKYLAHHFRSLIKGAPIEKYSVQASTDSQVALISLGVDSAVGVVGRNCISVPTRLIF